MKTTLTAQKAQIGKFIELFQTGVNAWIQAGEMLVEMVEEDPHVYDYIIQQCPTLNAGILGRFEQMGRKILHPQLLLSASPGFSKLSKLPFSMQERYLSEPVPIIVHTENGPDVLLVETKNMTKDQASQVFAPGRIRTEGEQRAWLMQQRSNAAKPVGSNVAPWAIKGGRVVFVAGATLSAGELATIITQLTK
jgi:hypothetical protein